MRYTILFAAIFCLGFIFSLDLKSAPKFEIQDEPFPNFKMEEIEKDFKVGYAVLLEDVNHDGKKDIVVVDTTRVLWYENPTWKKRVMIEGQTKPDNVSIAAQDIDGDGKVDFALGADWRPFNTQSGGTIQWLTRGKTLEDPWVVYPIGTEPMVHRIRFADTDGDGKLELIVVPLMGRGSTGAKNWMNGAPVRVLAFDIPKDPRQDRWVPRVLNQSLHVVHNFYPIPRSQSKGMDILTASYEGVHLLKQTGKGNWKAIQVGTGNQDQPTKSKGASEIKQGRLKSGKKYIATVEPWHGNQIVVYSEPKEPGMLWDRHMIDDKLNWGHAVWCADLDGDGGDELIIGVRDDPRANEKNKDRRGVRIFKALTEDGSRWQRSILENGGVAVEDLAAADLNGDGRIDLVAVGRQTHNMRIYWNLGKSK